MFRSFPKRKKAVAAAVAAVALLGLTVTVLTIGATSAQDENPAERPVATAPQQAERLTEAFERLMWDASRHGPLLAVEAPKPPPGPQQPGPPQTVQEPGSDRYSGVVAQVAAWHGRVVMRAGSVTVLAPAVMTILNQKPGEPDLTAGMERRDRMHWLMASLTPAQWQKVGSAEGLGIGDLSPEQRPLFLSLLPDPFIVREVTVDGTGYEHGGDNAPDVTLSPQ